MCVCVCDMQNVSDESLCVWEFYSMQIMWMLVAHCFARCPSMKLGPRYCDCVCELICLFDNIWKALSICLLAGGGVCVCVVSTTVCVHV